MPEKAIFQPPLQILLNTKQLQEMTGIFAGVAGGRKSKTMDFLSKNLNYANTCPNGAGTRFGTRLRSSFRER
jgi:hypothetical protein